MAYSTIKGLQFGDSTGPADAYVVSIGSVNLVDGFVFELKINTSNLGASTLDVNGTGAKSLLDSDLNPLAPDDIEQSSIYLVSYNTLIPGGGWQLLGLAKPASLPSYGHVYANAPQVVAYSDPIVFNFIQNNTPDILLSGSEITVLTAGTYKIDFVLTVDTNTTP